MPDVREVYEMVTKQKPPEPGALQRQQKRQVRAARNKKVGAFALAAAIGVAAVALILVNRPEQNTTTPANEPTVNPVDAEAVQVATGFLEAFGAFDVEQAMTYLADDADIMALTESSNGVEGLSLMTSFLEAQGYQQTITSCEASTLASDTSVVCAYDFHGIRSDEIGRGPFSGGAFTLTIRDGEIVRASRYWEIEEFSPQMWEPFAEWVSTTYPEDAAVMYQDGTLSNFRLTEESIRLWERRTKEYVQVEISKMVEIAANFMESRNAYDVETAMSLLADDGATARLMYENALHPDLRTIQLNRDELALALEAERLYGVRYESFECRPASVVGEAQVVCSYLMDNKLRQIQGFPPVESSFRIGVRDDRIDYLSFPWLSIGFGPGGYHPAEGGRFARWLKAEHPEAVEPFGRGELFRTEGQELIHILTPDSLDLLAGYLEEYERSVSG